MTSYPRAERRALADLMADLGPDAPTLCGGWRTRDLAAHLLLREGRPAAAVGISLPALAGWTQRVQSRIADRPYDELVEAVRTGPPPWSPYRVPAVKRAANTVEYVVHHEDVRRAQDGWKPRELDAGLEEELAVRLAGMARMLYRRVPVGVTLRREDGGTLRVKDGARNVTVTGPPIELLLHAFGRGDQARVQVDGDQVAVFELGAAPLGV